MPEQGRILKFRQRHSAEAKSRADAVVPAQAFLARSGNGLDDGDCDAAFADPDVLMAICNLLRERVNSRPTEVLGPATRMFAWVSSRSRDLWFFDERDYFLGESALLAGCATRLLGDRTESELWLDRADASYRHTINPTPNLARVSYIRLTLRFDMHRHREVLELLPSVALTFEKLGMHSELAKCWFLEAMSQKAVGLSEQAARGFERIIAELRSEDSIRAMAMLNLGNLHSQGGQLEQALTAYREALPVLAAAGSSAALADLKGMVGETLRKLGRLGQAVAAFRESAEEYVRLGMQTRVAYVRVVTAEALLEFGSPREAEWELLAALPTLESQQMVPEAVTAIGLLRESVRRRKTDSSALARVREHLQTNS